MLARQFSIQTSYPSSMRTSTMFSRTGARKICARTPAPWTSSTGPLLGSRSPRTLTTLSCIPSPASKGTVLS